MSRTVSARLLLGFRAGLLYREQWSKNRRAVLAENVKDDIFAKTTTARRIQWGSVALVVDDNYRIEEIGVRDALAAELAKTDEPGATDPYILSLSTDGFGDPLAPPSVTYVIIGGDVVCQHDYLVSHELRGGGGGPTDWVVPDADEPANVVAQLAWSVPIL